MAKRNKKTGRFESQYKKSSIITNHTATYLMKLNWWERLEFLFSPAGFVARHIDLALWRIFKRLEDTDKL